MTIQIENISQKVTAHSLDAIFSTYGKVHSVTIDAVTVAETNRKALIIMPDNEEASKAIAQLHGCFVDGCLLSVIPLPARTNFLHDFFYKQKHNFPS